MNIMNVKRYFLIIPIVVFASQLSFSGIKPILETDFENNSSSGWGSFDNTDPVLLSITDDAKQGNYALKVKFKLKENISYYEQGIRKDIPKELIPYKKLDFIKVDLKIDFPVSYIKLMIVEKDGDWWVADTKNKHKIKVGEYNSIIFEKDEFEYGWSDKSGTDSLHKKNSDIVHIIITVVVDEVVSYTKDCILVMDDFGFYLEEDNGDIKSVEPEVIPIIQKDNKIIEEKTWRIEADICGSGGTDSNGTIYLRKVGENKREVIGIWSPEVVKSDDIKKPITFSILSFDIRNIDEGTYFLYFEYTSGQHGLIIKEVRLISKKGKKIVDTHDGFAGGSSNNNLYKFNLGEKKDVSSKEVSRVTIQVEDSDFDKSGVVEYDIYSPKDFTYDLYVKYANLTYHGHRGTPIFLDNKYIGYLSSSTKTQESSSAMWHRFKRIKLSKGYHVITLRKHPLTNVVGVIFEPVLTIERQKSLSKEINIKQDLEENKDDFKDITKWKYFSDIGNTEGTTVTLSNECIKGDSSMKIEYVFNNKNVNYFFGDDVCSFEKECNLDMTKYTELKLWMKGDLSKNIVTISCKDSNNNEKKLGFLTMRDSSWREYILPFDFAKTFAGDIFDETKVKKIIFTLTKAKSGKYQHGTIYFDNLRFIRGGIISNVDIDEIDEEYKENIFLACEKINTIKSNIKIEKNKKLQEKLKIDKINIEQVIPENYPEFKNSEIKPITRKDLDNSFHGTVSTNYNVDSLNKFFKIYNFGTAVSVPINNIMSKDDWQSSVKRIIDNKLYFIPGTSGGVETEYLKVNQSSQQMLKERYDWIRKNSGKYFLGFGDGESDLGYLQEYMLKFQIPNNKNEAYNNLLSFINMNKKVLGDYAISLGAVNFPHYYGEAGYRMLGLEIAQTLPSSMMMMSFIRGASKQYGRLWWDLISIYNKWGLKDYGAEGMTGGYMFGPTHGTSVSLMKRLWYVSFMYGASLIGFEGNQFIKYDTDIPELSPIGKENIDAVKWSKEHYVDRGEEYTPIALMLDLYSGWLPPKHQGSRGLSYYVWNSFQYSKGDYMIDNFFRLIYPGYQCCNFYEDERGYLTPTPYGDIFNVIMNNAKLDVLKRYNLIILLGELSINKSLEENLKEYVKNGGSIIITASQAKNISSEFTGVEISDEEKEAYCSLSLLDGKYFVEGKYIYNLVKTTDAEILALNEEEAPLITINKHGNGNVIVITPKYWMTDKKEDSDPYYRFLNIMINIIGDYIKSFNLVNVDNDKIQYITNINNKRELMLTLVNNSMDNQQVKVWFNIDILIKDIKELLYKENIKYEKKEFSVNIPGNDLRIYKIKMSSE